MLCFAPFEHTQHITTHIPSIIFFWECSGIIPISALRNLFCQTLGDHMGFWVSNSLQSHARQAPNLLYIGSGSLRVSSEIDSCSMEVDFALFRTRTGTHRDILFLYMWSMIWPPELQTRSFNLIFKNSEHVNANSASQLNLGARIHARVFPFPI